MKHAYLLRFLTLLLLLGPPALAQTLDPSFAPTVLKLASTNPFYVRAMLPQPDGKVVVAGGYDFVNGVLTSKVRRLNADGSVDAAFLTQTGSGPDVALVQALALQPDGKILVGSVNSVYYNSVYAPGLARLNADGSVDAAFNSGGVGFEPTVFGNTTVRSLAVQPDGRILVGGSMIRYNGQPISSLVRLNADGSVDNSFVLGSGVQLNTGPGTVDVILVQADGKIVIGGTFNSVNGTSVGNLARLNTDGTLDATFGVGTGAVLGVAGAVRAIVQQPDGKLLIGGSFNQFNSQPSGSVLRLNLNGTPDNTFQAGALNTNGAVYQMRLRADGSVLLMGNFTSYNGTPRGGVAKVSGTGALDPGFATGAGIGSSGGQVYDLIESANGQFLAGGTFASYDGTPRTGLARLSSTATLDPSYNPVLEFKGTVNTLAPLSNGQLVINGSFSSFNGTAVPNTGGLHLLNPDGTYNSAITPAVGGTYFVQPDGRIYVGRYTASNTTYSYSRLLPNGALDASFATVVITLPTAGSFRSLGPQVLPNGNILLSGNFTTINGVARPGVAQLLPNGTLDAFVPASAPWQALNDVPLLTPLPNGQILANWSDQNMGRSYLLRFNANGTTDNSYFVSQPTLFSVAGTLPGGEVLLTGTFTTFGALNTPNGLVRLGRTGVPDPGFSAAVALRTLYLQPDGRIIGLRINNPNPAAAQLVRLNPDGSLDTSFGPVAIPQSIYSGSVLNGIALQPTDNKILLWGGFARVAGETRIGLARLTNTLLATRGGRAALALTAYPNPAANDATLELPAPTTAARGGATLLDLQGRVVQRWSVPAGQTTVALPLGTVAPGLYVLRVETQHGPAQQRLAIQR
ncbi:hypothetical protein GCM10027048_19560 [Hymenobacter coalescens]